MGMFSFDVVSDFDKAEMNNVVDQAQREIVNRYDFKNSSAALEWLNGNKTGLKITGENQFHLDSIIEIVRKKAGTRGINQKTFDTGKEPLTSNLKMIWEVSFVQGLDQDKAKKVTSLIRDKFPKVKSQIQGQEVRVMSPKKDELQAVMQALHAAEFDFPLSFTNFR